MIIDDTIIDKLDALPSREKTHIKADQNDCRHPFQDFPFRRVRSWIGGQIGKDFDTVFSEFCKLKWLPHRHRTMQGIIHYLEVNTAAVDGKACVRDYFQVFKPIEEHNCDFFYVCPFTKTIKSHRRKKVNWKAIHAARKRETCIILAEDSIRRHQLCKIDGIWYEVKFCVSAADWIKKWYGGLYFNLGTPYQELRGAVHTDLKRQLNHRELRKYGLTNAAA